MNVVIVGFRCAGKTTTGRALAETMRMEFVDIDDFIESRTGLSIAEIFERCGESFFRELESQAVAEVTKNDGMVIATGGGAILRYKNIANMKRHGRIVYLKVRPQTAVCRIRHDPASARRRPRLTAAETLEEEVRRHMEFREAYYRSAADLVIEADELAVEEVVRRIIAGLRLTPPGDREDHSRPAPI